MKNNEELKKFVEENLKNNDENNPKTRMKDIEKSHQLINSSNEGIIKPRKRDNDFVASNESFLPSKKNDVQPIFNNQSYITPKNKSIENVDKQIIIPRKKPELKFVEESKAEITKTIMDLKENLYIATRNAPKEERRYFRQQQKIWRKVEKVENKLSNLIDRNGASTPKFEKTLELQNQYINKMRKINDQINSLYHDDMSQLSLADRRKAISRNSQFSSSKNIIKAHNIRVKDNLNKEFKKESPEYKKVEVNLNSYLSARNPFYERLQKINERGGVTLEQEFDKKQDRIAEKWLERAYNQDSGGKIKPRMLDLEETDGE